MTIEWSFPDPQTLVPAFAMISLERLPDCVIETYEDEDGCEMERCTVHDHLLGIVEFGNES